jgi:uncharacterized protein (TIGR00369 family)
MDPKTTSNSETTITELMIPAYSNLGGKIHGGVLLSLMDKVAYACATKHAGNYCVTVGVDAVNFLLPVEVGDLVSMMARVNYVGRTSLVVGIKVTAENVRMGMIKHTNTSYFTMVAKDDNNKTIAVPPLKLTSEMEVRRFYQAIFRKSLKTYMKDQIIKNKREDNISKILDELKDERCIIALQK